MTIHRPTHRLPLLFGVALLCAVQGACLSDAVPDPGSTTTSTDPPGGAPQGASDAGVAGTADLASSPAPATPTPGTPAPTGPVAGEPAELAGITNAHNATRAGVGVPSMTWNNELAQLATTFVADCVFAHSTQQERSNKAGFSYIGENLYMSGGFQPSGAQVSAAWASEAADYDYASNSCSAVCGHYTQQVWKTSTQLGCAMKACPGGKYVVACEYGPGGNFNGQRPY